MHLYGFMLAYSTYLDHQWMGPYKINKPKPEIRIYYPILETWTKNLSELKRYRIHCLTSFTLPLIFYIQLNVWAVGRKSFCCINVLSSNYMYSFTCLFLMSIRLIYMYSCVTIYQTVYIDLSIQKKIKEIFMSFVWVYVVIENRLFGLVRCYRNMSVAFASFSYDDRMTMEFVQTCGLV